MVAEMPDEESLLTLCKLISLCKVHNYLVFSIKLVLEDSLLPSVLEVVDLATESSLDSGLSSLTSFGSSSLLAVETLVVATLEQSVVETPEHSDVATLELSVVDTQEEFSVVHTLGTTVVEAGEEEASSKLLGLIRPAELRKLK